MSQTNIAKQQAKWWDVFGMMLEGHWLRVCLTLVVSLCAGMWLATWTGFNLF